MHERYSTDRMRMIWSDLGTMSLWATVECYMAKAQGATEEVYQELWEKRLPTKAVGLQEWRAEEFVTKHDVAAFVKLFRESVSPEASRWVHRGVTSSDLVDSAMASRVKESLGMIERAGFKLLNALGEKAKGHRRQPWIGRTHGQWAQETTFGHLLANRAMLVNRALMKVKSATFEQRVMMSGPVGDYATLGGTEKGKAAEAEFGRLMGMPVAAQSTQIVSRDGLAEAMWACERLMAAIAQVATDIRLMGQSEVGEVAESFALNQKGSSIMAHKNNTIGAENLVGLERVVRANVGPVVEGIATWGMRDISHSAVERVSVPLVLSITEFAALRCSTLVENLVVMGDRMLENIEKTGGVLKAGPLVTWLTENGADPEAAWKVVHVASSAVRGEDGHGLVRLVHKAVNDKVRRNEAGWEQFEGNWAEWR